MNRKNHFLTTILFSLGFHVLAMAIIFSLNVNTVKPSPTIETLPIIKVSLVYAMHDQGEKGSSPSRSDKKTDVPKPKERLITGPPVDTPSLTEKTEKQSPVTVTVDETFARSKVDIASGTEKIVTADGIGMQKVEAGLTVPVLPHTSSAIKGSSKGWGSGEKTGTGEGGLGNGLSKLSANVGELSASTPHYRATSRPAYPMIARLRGQEGVVTVSAEVLTDGTVGMVKINKTSGYVSLDNAALEAVKTWRFEPAKKMGKPIVAWVEVPVRFLLNDNE